MILITGADGQLGTDFQKLFDDLGESYCATDYHQLDITDLSQINSFFEKNEESWSLIINCAAYNNVDKAESESEKAFLLNRWAPEYLAKTALGLKIPFITYSSDFVFDGRKGSSYSENDPINPLSVYGRSKAEGEAAVLRVHENNLVIRTSWVFGKANQNFNTQVINWSKKNSELKIVDDQISSPTYSKDLADFSWKIYQKQGKGLFHFSNNGYCSKFDQAEFVLKKMGWKGNLRKAKTADFHLPAPRGYLTKLNSHKAEDLCEEIIPDWQDGLERYLFEMNLI